MATPLRQLNLTQSGGVHPDRQWVPEGYPRSSRYPVSPRPSRSGARCGEEAQMERYWPWL